MRLPLLLALGLLPVSAFAQSGPPLRAPGLHGRHTSAPGVSCLHDYAVLNMLQNDRIG